jgi:hypothetical protein
MRPTTVVNLTRASYDVYIGRPGKGKPARQCPWGNPFVLGGDGDRATVLAKYEQWIMRQPQLLARLGELRGKRLGCFCRPAEGFRGRVLCHGQILAALADGCRPLASRKGDLRCP